MKSLLISFLILNAFAFSQTLEMGVITRNFGIKSIQQQKSNNSIDSSFVFVPDTISLPFFDDFSTNKFQDYNADFNTPGLTNQLFYQLLDPITLNPFPSGTEFSNQQTFKRTFDLINNTFSDTLFNPISIKIGDFTSYPIQYETIDVYPPYYIYDTIGVSDETDTIRLENPAYLQDSARIFFTSINDQNKLWIDSFAYHNYRFGLNPRSLGVVTFDGLDDNGFPYQINTAITNYADRLTSKPIDLSGLSASDSIYFSFLYQAEGLGDIPEQNDSLILEFYAKDLDQWFRVWSVNGDTVYPFRAAHLKLSDPKYFKKGFQFRFRNYGSLAGSLDHFHVDFVHLRSLSTYEDTLFKDFAFVYPITSLLKTYTSVPWDHYKNSSDNKMTDSLFVQVHNGSPNPENYQNGAVNFSQNNNLQGSFILQGFTLAEQNINFLPRTFHNSYHNLTSGAAFSKSLLGFEQHFDVNANVSAQFPNEPINDSCSFTQHFYNYYSYDDGSAEAAFGPTGTQARLAIRFDAYESDSIIGINMHFVPSVTDVSNKLFLISVWADNNGEPGQLLYEDDVFFPRNPIYTNGINEFYTYYFKDTIKVAVDTRFYVGWRQLDGNRLNLGLDRNIDRSETIRFSVDGGNTWLTSPFPGTAMMRPVFSTRLDQSLGINPKNIQEKLMIYPNPTADYVNIVSSEYSDNSEIEFYDSFGRLIFKSTDQKIDLSRFESGIYFLRAPAISNKLFKLIKQ
jgi:hypothetical protein